MDFDAIVVGGGIIGMLTARNLSAQRLRVAIIDKGKLGGEATWAAGGILSSLHPWKHSSSNHDLIKEGQNNFPVLANELFESTGIDTELCKSGMLVLEPQEIQHATEWCTTHNVAMQHINKGLHKIEPNLSCYFDEALFFEEVFQIRPPLLIQALKSDLEFRGVKIFEQFEVEKLLINQNSILGVAGSKGSLYSEINIICNGAWASQLIGSLKGKLPEINPIRGQMLLYKPSKILLHSIIQHNGFYVIPRKDGYILCGSTTEDVGFNKKITHEAKTQLHQIAVQLLPELRNYAPIKQWAGLRPGTKGEGPFFGQHPQIEGLFLNIGHYRYGIVMSIACSRILSDFVIKSRSESHIPQFVC